MFLQRGDLKRVMAGVRRIESDLRMLRLDYSQEARVFHRIYLEKILKHTRDLELYLHVAILNGTMAGRQDGRKTRPPVLDDVHRIFISINPVLHLLHKVEFRARNGNPGIGLFDALEEDWEHFKRAAFKTIIPRRPYRTMRHWTVEYDVNRRRAWAMA